MIQFLAGIILGIMIPLVLGAAVIANEERNDK
jgi:hypothetical protein